MLASTVQFSNNDQPPITPGLYRSSLGSALKAASRPCPQTPNSVPDTLAASLNVPRPEEQYWKEKTVTSAE
jgi:hypothetical protein